MQKLSIPATDQGRREWIKARLRLAGYTLGDIARQSGLSRTAAQQALWKAYPRMERAIADGLGMAPEEIWPERYDASGAPRRRRARAGGGSMHADKTSTARGRSRGGKR